MLVFSIQYIKYTYFYKSLLPFCIKEYTSNRMYFWFHF